MRRLKKIIIGVAIFFFVFTVAGFFIVPPILKSILTKKLSEALHREVTIKEIKINPYTFSLTGKGFKVNERDSTETFLSFDELFLNLQSLSALKWAILLKEIRIKQPYLKIIRHQDSSFNFSDLMGKKELEKKVEEEGKEKGIPLRFSFNNISIENGSIDFYDEPKATKHAVRELNFGLPFLSNIPYDVEAFVQPALSAKINETPYSIQGKTKPFSDSRETSFDINISDFNIPYYIAYAPIKMNFKILSGYLDVKGKITFIQYKDKNKPPSLKTTGEVAIKKLAVDDSEGKPLLRLPLFETSIASGEPISKSFHLSKISIQSPEFHIRRDPRGTLNIETLLPKEPQTQKKTTKQENSSPLSLDIDEITMGKGKIFFSDLSGSKSFKTIIDPVELRINHFSNGKDKKSVYTLLLKTEAKETIQLEGELSVNPLLTEGKLEIKSVPFKKYSPYYSDKFLFDIEDGMLDLSTRYKYAKGGRAPEIYLSEMSTAIRKLRLKGFEENEDFLNIPVLSVKNTALDLTKKEISVGEFSTQKGALLVRRLENGKINLLNLLPPAKKQEQESVQAGTGTKEQEKPWSVKAKRILVDLYTIKGEDQVPVEPVNLMIDKMSFKAENFSTEQGHRGSIALTLHLNQKGTMTATGSIGIQPLFANLNVALKKVGIKSFQPYFTDRVKITVTDGFFSTAGNLILKDQKEKGIQMTFKGKSSLSNFASIDKVNAEDFLKWESLSLENIHLGYNPLFIHLNAIALANFYARVIIYPDGSINLQKILEEGEEKEKIPPSTPPQAKEKESPSQNEETTPKDIKIEKVVLQGGHVNFSDFFIKPNYTANMMGMGGRISGLSSEETTLAEVEVRGKLNDYAPFEIIGKINPLKEDPHVDLEVKFKDIDLSPFTPYSGKYVGYTVQKGKLSMDLKYLIVNKKLTAQNKIFFDQFTFGDKIESPEATKLPVKFAVSLLKDRKGEIHLDIPLSGSLDDPKFGIGEIILQILTNLISKAATSPFALLGGAFGGGEEISYLEFDYGSFKITEPNMKKIDTLIKALRERPGIRLDIEGHVDVERDREGLKQYLFQKKIKVQKLNEMVKKGSPAVPVDEIKIEPEEYERYLKMAYKAEKFPKPKNILGFPKDLPVPEMEKLMLTHAEVKEGDLRSLASQRASRVKGLILKSGQIASERIFLIEPESLAPKKKEKLKDSRVDFKLK